MVDNKFNKDTKKNVCEAMSIVNSLKSRVFLKDTQHTFLHAAPPDIKKNIF